MICVQKYDLVRVVLACAYWIATIELSDLMGGQEMSTSALNNPRTAAASEGELRDPVVEALKVIEQTHAAIAKIRVQIDDSTRMLSELLKVSAVFDSVADRLVDATFKASGEATRGVPSHTVLVAFVEELGDLARLALGGVGDVRREVRACASSASQPAIFHDTDLALQELAANLRRIAQRPTAPASTGSIEIENRAGRPPPPPPPRAQSALDRILTAGVFAHGAPKSGGYKN